MSRTLQEELSNFQHTKNIFKNAERLFRTAQFSGKECEQVTECIALMRYMVDETDRRMKEMVEKARKANAEVPKPVAPAVPSDSVLGEHLPDDGE